MCILRVVLVQAVVFACDMSLPVYMFEALCYLRLCLGLSWEEVACRASVQSFEGAVSLYFCLRGLLYDGTSSDACWHQGFSGMVHHGTKDYKSVLAWGGILCWAQNTAAGCHGWYCFDARQAGCIRRALGYAAVERIGHGDWRAVFDIECRCYNRVPGRDWYYCRCNRYTIVGIRLVSADGHAS